MIDFRAKIQDQLSKIITAARKAAFKNFGHAAASMAKDAKASIEQADGPSEPGTPPHTHKGKFLARAIRYDANSDGAVIGPMASVVGDVGAADEFGGEFRGQEYPERAFMYPALERGVDRFASDWQGSVGE